MRGNQGKAKDQPDDKGLSPRLRGNHARLKGHAAYSRSIPAFAGEPLTVSTLSLTCKVYPRVCGGTQLDAIQKKSAQGLSPRLRGNHQNAAPDDPRFRSIPAFAGEPRRLGLDSVATTVYPPRCGGTRWNDPDPNDMQGLSPRLRGNRFEPSDCGGGKGLSPRLRGNRPWGVRQDIPGRSIPAFAGEP